MSKPCKLLFIGLDGMISGYLERYIREKKMPHMSRLFKQGSYTRILPAFPCDTPTNWTSFATGSWPGTHGIVGFNIHEPGEPLTTHHETLHTGMCHSEFIWDVAERAGMTPLLVTYPGAWPTNLKRGLVIQGMHGDCTFSPRQLTPPPSRRQTIDSPALYRTTGKEDARFVARPLIFNKPEPIWHELPASCKPPLEAQIPISANSGLEWSAMGWSQRTHMNAKQDVPLFRLLLTASTAKGYDHLLIFRKPNAQPIVTLKQGEWSQFLTERLCMENGKHVTGWFCFKLQQLSDNGKTVELYRSKIYKTSGWARPRIAEKEIVREVGPFVYGFEQGAGYCDLELCLEHAARQSENYVKLAQYALQKRGCDFMMIKIHVQDAFNHWLLNEFDPSWALYNPKACIQASQFYERSYRVVDRLVGDLIQAVADDKTVIAVASDHGAVPIPRKIDYRPIFIKAGLLKYRKTKAGYVVDLPRTRALMIGDQIFINCKGREKGGIVSPKGFNAVRDQIVEALNAVRDPATGDCPFEAVLRKEDLAIHGVWGPRYGDVIPIARTGYWLVGGEILPHAPAKENPAKLPAVQANNERPLCGAHFGVLPNAQKGLASNHAWFLMSGPTVRRGYYRPTCAAPISIAPTLCNALTLPYPAHCEGGPLIDFFKLRRKGTS